MRLLLDTCCVLWALQNFGRLSVRAQRALKDPRNTVSVSVLSFWEISLKTSVGKLTMDGGKPDEFPRYVAEAGWEILPLDPDTVATSGRLPRVTEHRDPFDRLLVWCAIRENYSLVSRDRCMQIYSSHGLEICW